MIPTIMDGNFGKIERAINGLALPLRTVAHRMQLTLDVLASIDAHLESIDYRLQRMDIDEGQFDQHSLRVRDQGDF